MSIPLISVTGKRALHAALETDSWTSRLLLDRYYDPITDQFLSVDPDLAETGQPYAFTGDDPLNATDPLGLAKGGPQNKSSKEFEGYSDAALNKLYKSLKGRLSAADKALKLRVAAEQKARKLRGSTGGGGPIKFVSVAPSAELGPNQSPHLVPIASLQSPPDPTGPALQAPASPGFGSLLPLVFLFVARAGAGTACGLAASETGPGAAAAFAACAGAA